MELRHCVYVLLLVVNYESSSAQSNRLLQFLLQNITPKQFYATNELIFDVLTRASRLTSTLDQPRRNPKLQRRVPESTPFPCDVSKARSPERPTSVHALRPGDIDVLGSMGDSLTAAYGALAVDVHQVIRANRGVSWSGGGQGTWREFLTIPNILKEFNPRLVGYSLGDSLTWQKTSQFNVAEGGAIAEDLPHQARILTKRMKSDKRVDFENDWKLVTLFIGGNDHCTYLCFETEEQYLAKHRRVLMETLDILHDSIPRLLVNFMPGPNLEVLMKFTRLPTECWFTQSVSCPCIVGSRYASKRDHFVDVMRRWQLLDVEIANMPRYRDKDDFAVVSQDFSLEITFPQRLVGGENHTDYSYMSADCFHFSQKCSAITANALWNNMLEPVGSKTRNWDTKLLHRFLCPTDEHPYIYTWANSNSVK